MLQGSDLDRILKIWGPIKSPISMKSIELWGRRHPESVISLYRMLGRGSTTTRTMASRHRNKSGMREH